MNKEQANEILSYAIQVLKGRKIVSTAKGRVHIALILKDRLKDGGFWWQSKIIGWWIHRCQKGEFITRPSAEGRVYEPRGEGSHEGGAS